MVRTIVAVLASTVLTTVVVPVWFIALILIWSFFNENINEASVAGYGRYCFTLAIPVALLTGVVIAPMFNLFAAKVSRSKSRALLSLTVLFWLGYLLFHILGDYALGQSILPLEWMMYYLLALFLAPPVYVGCCAYMAIAERAFIAQKIASSEIGGME